MRPYLLCFAASSVFTLWSALPAATAAADSFPQKPIRLVIGFTPGGQPDIVARILTPHLYEHLGQQVVIDNRPGAGGVLGAKIVADAPADGYTLLTSSSSIASSPSIYAHMPFDTRRDFAGITTTYSASYVLAVPPSLPVKNLQEFVALARAKPGQMNFSSSGNGSAMHLAGELIKQTLNIDLVHVPYKGVPEALTDTIAGRVQLVAAPVGSTVALLHDGKLKGLAVTGSKRTAVHPDIPTLTELGYPGFRFDSWGGVFAPSKTPRPLIERLNQEFVRALNDPDVQPRLAALGMDAAPCTPAQLDKLLAEQIVLIAQLAKKAGIVAH